MVPDTNPPTRPEARVLIEARELIRQGWTRGQDHRRVRGKDCYCALGAIWKAAGGLLANGAIRAEYELRAVIGPDSPYCSFTTIAHWNDQQKSKHPVLAAFDRAIEAVS